MEPASGAGVSANQPVHYRVYAYDPGGWSSGNDTVIVDVSPVYGSQPWNNTCNIQYQPVNNTVILMLDNGTQWVSGIPGSATVLSNSRCSVPLASTTAWKAGGGVEWNLYVTFTSSYVGTKYNYVGIYKGSVGSFTWFYAGPITIYSSQSMVNLIQPANGANVTAEQAVTYSIYGFDPANWSSINDYLILEVSPVAGSQPWSNVCNVQYQPFNDTVYLTLDSGSQWASGAPGSSAVLSNSQCSIALAGTTVSRSGGSITWTMPVTFTNNYVGTRYNYVGAYKGYFNWYYFGSIAIQPASSENYYLTTSVDPPGAGTLSPPSGFYSSGSVLSVMATAAPGYQFSFFTGALIGITNPQTLVLSESTSVTAHFNPILGQYYLTTAVNPPGAGTIAPPSGYYSGGSVVTVTATPGPGYQFAGFSGALSGTTNPQNLTITGNASVTANFTPIPAQYYLTTGVSPPGAGSISPASGYYTSGSVVTVSATPAPGYQFAGFTGALSGTINPQSLTITANASVTATFVAVPPQYYLTTAVSPPGGGSISPASAYYTSGSVVTVTATPAAGYYFAGFTGALTGSTSPQNLTIIGNATVTAIFTTVPPPPDFALDLPASVTVEAGFQNSFRLRITPLHGFSSPVTWTVTHGVSGVNAIWAANSQPALAPTTATATLTAAASVVPGTYTLTVRADGGGISRSANVNLSVIRPYRAQSETNMAFVDFLNYNDSTPIPSNLPVLQAACPTEPTMRACYQKVLDTYRDQQISGVRFMFAMSNAVEYYTGAVNQTWLAGVRLFFQDLYERNIHPITPTPSWDHGHLDGPYYYATPALKPGCTDPNFYQDPEDPQSQKPRRIVTQLRFNRTAPFGEAFVRHCDQQGLNCTDVGWQVDGEKNVNAYHCAMGNVYFLGWNKMYDVIDAMLQAARDNALTVQEFDVTNEIQLSDLPVRARLIVDNVNYDEDVLGDVSLPGRRSLRHSMQNHGFDPSRVTYSVIGSNSQRPLGECPASNPPYFGDSGRIKELSLITAVIGTGGPIGMHWSHDLFDWTDPRFPGTALTCGGFQVGLANLPLTHSQPTIIDVHSGPCVVVQRTDDSGNEIPGWGECDPNLWSDLAGEARAMGNALAAFQESFSPGGWRGYVPNLANALVMLGETHGRVKPGDPNIQATNCRAEDRTPEYTACRMSAFDGRTDKVRDACWKISASQDTYNGFNSSTLASRIRPNGLPATIVFRPWEYLQQYDEPQANACNALSTNPPYTPIP